MLRSSARFRILGLTSRHFSQGLRDLGYIEGKNIAVEYRDAEGKPDRFPSLLTELVRLKVDVIVAPSTTSDPGSEAGDQNDPYCHGDRQRSSCGWVIASLARPGGNITGLTSIAET